MTSCDDLETNRLQNFTSLIFRTHQHCINNILISHVIHHVHRIFSLLHGYIQQVLYTILLKFPQKSFNKM